MELMNKKLTMMKKLHSLTQHMSEVSLEENISELNFILENRQKLMDKIDEIDEQIKKITFKDEEEKKIINNEINSYIKQIIDMDSTIKMLISNKGNEVKGKYIEIDDKLKTGNYIIDDEDRKIKGYFLNTKG